MRLCTHAPVVLPRRGSAMVEFAVVAPVLVTLMLGMVEVTRAIQVKNLLTDAARASCRAAAMPGASTQDVKDRVGSILSNNGIKPADATVNVLVNGKALDAQSAVNGDRIDVQISVPISKINWVSPLFFSTMAIESETLVMMRQ
jgi:hypothetical protein